MTISFGNIGISGIVYAGSGALYDVSGVAVTNSSGNLVSIINLPQSFAKMKAQGSRISNFDMYAMKFDVPLFTKSVSGESIELTRTEIVELRAIEPEYFLLTSNEDTIDLDTGESINFRFCYPFNPEKLYPERISISSSISSAYTFLRTLDEESITKIQNAFGFDINNIITPSGDDNSIADIAIPEAIEINKRLTAVTELTTSVISGVDALDCWPVTAQNILLFCDGARSGIKTFFDENTSGIVIDF
ncbi:MAG: hypothetical protein EBU90_03825 [Proteobacteria bacterium]|nr:hypothetical protein [Pseudomonadota bacterium]